MIQIPYCLRCKNIKEGMVCDAYPNRIPKEVLREKKKEGTVCNNNVGFIKVRQSVLIKKPEKFKNLKGSPTNQKNSPCAQHGEKKKDDRILQIRYNFPYQLKGEREL